MLIYIITNDVNDKVYIGQTVKSLEERKNQHYSSFISGTDTHLYNAMRKYGWDRFHFSKVASASSLDELNALEKAYIEQFDSIRNGYNMIPGGRSNPMDTLEVRQKHDAVMRSQDVRSRIGNTIREQCKGGRSAEYRKKMSEGKKALYASARGEIAKAKFRESFKFSEEHFRALNDSKNKEVYCVDESGQEVARFSRVKDAAQWWYDQGYVVKDVNQLSDAIKLSSKKDKYIRGLKWIYCV